MKISWFLGLFFVNAWVLGQAQPIATNRPFESEIRAFEATDKTTPPPQNAIVFTGSSSIRLWENLAALFP